MGRLNFLPVALLWVASGHSHSLRSFEGFYFIGWLEIVPPKKSADGVHSARTAGIDKETIQLASLASAPAA
jgi:hypothetical protein